MEPPHHCRFDDRWNKMGKKPATWETQITVFKNEIVIIANSELQDPLERVDWMDWTLDSTTIKKSTDETQAEPTCSKETEAEAQVDKQERPVWARARTKWREKHHKVAGVNGDNDKTYSF